MAGAEQSVAVGGQVVAAGQAGEGIAAGGVQLAAYADVVGEDGQGERDGRRSDDEGAGPLT
jgi:hypothetical protein